MSYKIKIITWLIGLTFICFTNAYTFGQQLIVLTELDNLLGESSGLIQINNKIITINDSGSSPTLYELDKSTGSITRSVTVVNATNKDWEAITADSQYIYIGDFGNNQGARKDLRIFRILLSDYLQTTNDSVSADTIKFSYLDQTDFTPSNLTTNYDAESLISFGDSLYIFSKNWGNAKTYIYPIPKDPGNYQLKKMDSIDAGGLVTDACIHPLKQEIVLIGHSLITPFTIRISSFQKNNFAEGTIDNYTLQIPDGFTFQIEGITASENEKYYVTCEDNFLGDAGLFHLEFEDVSPTEDIKLEAGFIFPNPATHKININYPSFAEAALYDQNGNRMLITAWKTIDISRLANGVYYVVLKNRNGDVVGRDKLVVEGW